MSVMLVVFMLKTDLLQAQCTTVDQSQLNYNGGMSARNVYQYSEWQDFTAGATGNLCKIEVGFFNAMTGTGTFIVFSGTGTGGTVLQSQTVTVSGAGNFFQSFFVSVPVISGSVYTFQFIPTQGGGLPDPYGVQVQSPGTYAGGEMRITDPSGTSATGFDMVFKTYVSPYTNVNENPSASPIVTIAPNPFSTETTLKSNTTFTNALVIIYNVFGQEIKRIANISGSELTLHRDNLDAGMYFIRMEEGGKTIMTNKLIIAE